MAEITSQEVERLERLASLSLTPERRQRVAEILNAWIPAANELSQKMASPQFRSLTPAIHFSDPNLEEGTEE